MVSLYHGLSNSIRIPFMGVTIPLSCTAAGLDSTSTAFAHLNKKQLLITAWGHWDIPLAERGLWQARRSKIEAFAHEWGNETSFIKSNYPIPQMGIPCNPYS